ncbi:MAG: hypothetical protein MUD03_11850 [Pirellula sp.]|nr:hypothetical protein [Pirellula sp.]
MTNKARNGPLQTLASLSSDVGRTLLRIERIDLKSNRKEWASHRMCQPCTGYRLSRSFSAERLRRGSHGFGEPAPQSL